MHLFSRSHQTAVLMYMKAHMPFAEITFFASRTALQTHEKMKHELRKTAPFMGIEPFSAEKKA